MQSCAAAHHKTELRKHGLQEKWRGNYKKIVAGMRSTFYSDEESLLIYTEQLFSKIRRTRQEGTHAAEARSAGKRHYFIFSNRDSLFRYSLFNS